MTWIPICSTRGNSEDPTLSCTTSYLQECECLYLTRVLQGYFAFWNVPNQLAQPGEGGLSVSSETESMVCRIATNHFHAYPFSTICTCPNIFVCCSSMNGSHGEWTESDDMEAALGVVTGKPLTKIVVPSGKKKSIEQADRVRAKKEAKNHLHKRFTAAEGFRVIQICKNYAAGKCTNKSCHFVHGSEPKIAKIHVPQLKNVVNKTPKCVEPKVGPKELPVEVVPDAVLLQVVRKAPSLTIELIESTFPLVLQPLIRRPKVIANQEHKYSSDDEEDNGYSLMSEDCDSSGYKRVGDLSDDELEVIEPKLTILEQLHDVAKNLIKDIKPKPEMAVEYELVNKHDTMEQPASKEVSKPTDLAWMKPPKHVNKASVKVPTARSKEGWCSWVSRHCYSGTGVKAIVDCCWGAQELEQASEKTKQIWVANTHTWTVSVGAEQFIHGEVYPDLIRHLYNSYLSQKVELEQVGNRMAYDSTEWFNNNKGEEQVLNRQCVNNSILVVRWQVAESQAKMRELGALITRPVTQSFA